MLSYRVVLDVPFQLVVFVSGLLADHRRELGTRDGTPKWRLAEQYGISLGSVKNLLRERKIRRA